MLFFYFYFTYSQDTYLLTHYMYYMQVVIIKLLSKPLK